MIPAGKPAFYAPYAARYVRRYLERSFHAIHLLGEPPNLADDGHTPLLVCLNHSSWWDVMVPCYLEDLYFHWERYGVMDEEQLKRYRLFSGLGMIGVDRATLQGAREFLDYAEGLLNNERRALWLTPQGAMLSPYVRPMRFQPGVAHLAQRLGRFHLLRIALNYEFWDEKRPEAFVSFSPIELIEAGKEFNRKEFLHRQESALSSQLDTLLTAVQSRDHSQFQTILHGSSGVSPVFDGFRALSSRLRGERLLADHGDVSTPQWKERER